MADGPHDVPTDEPREIDGYVAYEQPDEPVLKSPSEAEVLAFNLLSAASQARAHRLSDSETETPLPDDLKQSIDTLAEPDDRDPDPADIEAN